ncbi:hypothetical protein DSCW_38980 [Desulfosarcina widdelii]|uniref:Uncharacterized protein n=1 Tax=Desulfosarcina widdelii TaxID=947919 RepID=A0A5K7Z9W3_9BACT|nr:hypothetical protein DSCW_38980 [Desulfosarcina widdelii]
MATVAAFPGAEPISGIASAGSHPKAPAREATAAGSGRGTRDDGGCGRINSGKGEVATKAAGLPAVQATASKTVQAATVTEKTTASFIKDTFLKKYTFKDIRRHIIKS